MKPTEVSTPRRRRGDLLRCRSCIPGRGGTQEPGNVISAWATRRGNAATRSLARAAATIAATRATYPWFLASLLVGPCCGRACSGFDL